jgi:phage tail-like protein
MRRKRMATAIVKNAHRFDPYRRFKFRLKWDNKTVMGVSKMTRTKWSSNECDTITMEYGVTYDKQFETWVNSPGEAQIKKDLVLELMSDGGSVYLRYILQNCSVSQFDPLPGYRANAVAIGKLKIETESWKST